MSQANVEMMGRIVDVFNSRDMDKILSVAHTKIEIHTLFAAVGGSTYYGRAGVRRWHEEMVQIFPDELRVEPEAYFDLGDGVLAYLLLYGRGGQSGVDVRAPIAQIHRFRDGLDIYWKSYVDRGEALRELGVSENDRERIGP
jgi:ketosteroid isomerase-like protein